MSVSAGKSAVLLFLAGSLAACSSAPTRTDNAANPADPAEGFNRAMHTFNQSLPFSGPTPARGVLHPMTLTSNVFSNLKEVPDAINHVLQGEPASAVNDLERFGINSTVGLAGVFDIASATGRRKESEDFGQTLGRWGVGSGAYLVLPFIGSSSVRDLASRPVDSGLNPISYSENSLALGVVDIITQVDDADEPVLDDYARQRDAWLIYRAKQIAE